MALQVGFEQVGGDFLRLLHRAAGRAHDGAQEIAEGLCLDVDGIRFGHDSFQGRRCHSPRRPVSRAATSLR